MLQPFQQMVTHSQSIGQQRVGWIQGRTGGIEARIDHIQIIDLMGVEYSPN